MYAIIQTCGKQYKVAEGDLLTVDHIAKDPGSTIEFDQVLAIGGDKAKVGAPTVKGAKVTAEVVGHELGEKRVTFKYVRRRRSRHIRGFRPSHTTLRIQKVSG